MTFVISEPCVDVRDGSCVEACPVECIYEVSRMFVIDPDGCIDCGACWGVCPVDAIAPSDEVPHKWEPFITINAAWLDGRRQVDAALERYMAGGAAVDHGQS